MLLEVVTLSAVLLREGGPFVAVGLLIACCLSSLFLLGRISRLMELGEQGAALHVVLCLECLDGRLVLTFERGEELAFLPFLSGDELAHAPVLRHNLVEHARQVALMFLALFANGGLDGGSFKHINFLISVANYYQIFTIQI